MNRWVNKVNNSVANVTDELKVYLRNTAHSTTHDDTQLVVKIFLNADFLMEKQKISLQKHGSQILGRGVCASNQMTKSSATQITVLCD